MNELSEEQLITYDELITAMHEQIVEDKRRHLQHTLNEDALPLEELKRRHGQVWTTDELIQQFEIVGFSAPFAVVKRQPDGMLGSVLFQHQPRYYWGFKEDRV